MSKMRFAVIGDTHFCTEQIRGKTSQRYPLSDIPDHVRYAQMVDTVLKQMFMTIKSFDPDLIVSTGDFVEGGMHTDEEATYQEMREGWQMLKDVGCPILIAKGTHEGSGEQIGAKAYNGIVLPGMSEMLEQPITDAYFCYERQGNLFIILDYLSYKLGGAQDQWLEHKLKEYAEKAEHIFIFTHPPLYNWGRHYFTESAFRKRLKELCDTYPVDIYFCGHTHNQAVSYHENDSNNLGFLQVMASSVGYPAMDIISLADFHALADFSTKDHYYWGIFEDSAPGFYIVDIDHNDMTVKWYGLKNDPAELVINGRRTSPAQVKEPKYKKYENELHDTDFDQIKAANLYVFGYYGDGVNSGVSFNGISLGQLPSNVSYAARRYLPLNNDALLTIKRQNHVRFNLPENDEFAIGSVSLELVLYDNRIIHSAVCPDIVTCGQRWSEFDWMTNKITEIEQGKPFSLTLRL